MRRPALLAALIAVSAASAQPTAQTVDADLLYGLLGVEDPSALDIGGAPSPKLQALVPYEATVLATVTYPLPLGSGEREVVLGRVEATPRDAAAAYGERLPEGWFAPEPYEPSPYGFASSEFAERAVTQIGLCPADGTEQVASVEFDPRPGGGSYVKVSRLDIGLAGRCGPGETERPPYAAAMDELERQLPSLRAPEGALLRTTGSGGGLDEREQSATLAGAGSLADVAAHFDEQMARAGWASRGSSVEADLAVSTWTHESDRGLLVLMLTVRPDGPDSYDLRLSMLAPAAD